MLADAAAKVHRAYRAGDASEARKLQEERIDPWYDQPLHAVTCLTAQAPIYAQTDLHRAMPYLLDRLRRKALHQVATPCQGVVKLQACSARPHASTHVPDRLRQRRLQVRKR